jgi:hypothetical protein
MTIDTLKHSILIAAMILPALAATGWAKQEAGQPVVLTIYSDYV